MVFVWECLGSWCFLFVCICCCLCFAFVCFVLFCFSWFGFCYFALFLFICLFFSFYFKPSNIGLYLLTFCLFSIRVTLWKYKCHRKPKVNSATYHSKKVSNVHKTRSEIVQYKPFMWNIANNLTKSVLLLFPICNLISDQITEIPTII